jgi:anti-sigma regulatory factor (Ser/Thr protein kinase)
VSGQQTFAPAPESVSKARRFVVSALADAPTPMQQAAAVVVSELATNCVVHARTAFQVSLLRTGLDVRLEVTDTGDGKVGVRRPSVTETSGRGLQMVEQLAVDWGVSYSPNRAGKTVWCTFVLPATDPAPNGSGRHRRS